MLRTLRPPIGIYHDKPSLTAGRYIETLPRSGPETTGAAPNGDGSGYYGDTLREDHGKMLRTAGLPVGIYHDKIELLVERCIETLPRSGPETTGAAPNGDGPGDYGDTLREDHDDHLEELLEHIRYLFPILRSMRALVMFTANNKTEEIVIWNDAYKTQEVDYRWDDGEIVQTDAWQLLWGYQQCMNRLYKYYPDKVREMGLGLPKYFGPTISCYRDEDDELVRARISNERTWALDLLAYFEGREWRVALGKMVVDPGLAQYFMSQYFALGRGDYEMGTRRWIAAFGLVQRVFAIVQLDMEMKGKRKAEALDDVERRFRNGLKLEMRIERRRPNAGNGDQRGPGGSGWDEEVEGERTVAVPEAERVGWRVKVERARIARLERRNREVEEELAEYVAHT